MKKNIYHLTKVTSYEDGVVHSLSIMARSSFMKCRNRVYFPYTAGICRIRSHDAIRRYGIRESQEHLQLHFGVSGAFKGRGCEAFVAFTYSCISSRF